MLIHLLRTTGCSDITDLMRQNVDVMADVARGRGVLLLCVLILRRRLHLDLTLHVGLFDHLHLRQRQAVGGGALGRDRRRLQGAVLYVLAPWAACCTGSSRRSRCRGDSP